MIGMEFADDGKSDEPSIVKRLVAEARSRGLLLFPAGAKGNVVRILVPLVIQDDELDLALSRLEASCDAVLS